MNAFPTLLGPADGRYPDYQGEDLDLPRFVEVFKGALHTISLALPGRMTLLQQSALALLTRRHQLLISRAGTGKSLYGDCLFGQFSAQVYKAQFTQGTRLETVLGGLDLQQFREGRLWHDTRHSLVTADFAYLDEFMNASDVVLEALLGILNERHFSQGEQQEDARLHTALAMTNHLKFTMISEPILDRFMFKASIDPHSDPLNDLLIDFAYESHHGRPVAPAHPIPVEMLRYASGVVQGLYPEVAVHASHAVLFLKNQVIDTYVDLLARHGSEPAGKNGAASAATLYISPRTKAASRDALAASALLHHRREVSADDLQALRYVLTTVDGNDGAAHRHTDGLFARALESVRSAFSEDDLQAVEELSTIAQNFQWYIHGAPLEVQRADHGIIRLFLTLIGRSSWHDVTYDTFVSALHARKIANPRVNQLRDEILDVIAEYARP